jgi:catechol 2,3-dioxygenase-like lactoylglutathione lyase family enzyme
MIGYVTVGTRDLKKAGEFYDKICGELGMGRFMANERFIAWGGRGRGQVLAWRCPMTESR